jgi:hypothetical protein
LDFEENTIYSIILNESQSMTVNTEVIDMAQILAVLSNEEELIIKPFQTG